MVQFKIICTLKDLEVPMSNFEKKFGKYAIRNISLMLIMCYVVGYVIQMIGDGFEFSNSGPLQDSAWADLENCDMDYCAALIL